MGKSRNTFNTTLKKTGRLDKMIAFSVLTIVTLLVCVSVITLWRELRHPIFLEVIVELTHLDLQTVLTIYSTLLYDIWLDKSLCTFVRSCTEFIFSTKRSMLQPFIKMFCLSVDIASYRIVMRRDMLEFGIERYTYWFSMIELKRMCFDDTDKREDGLSHSIGNVNNIGSEHMTRLWNKCRDFPIG
jgi:hypothetical protein